MLILKCIETFRLKCRKINDDLDSDFDGGIGSSNDEEVLLEVENEVYS